MVVSSSENKDADKKHPAAVDHTTSHVDGAAAHLASKTASETTDNPTESHSHTKHHASKHASVSHTDNAATSTESTISEPKEIKKETKEPATPAQPAAQHSAEPQKSPEQLAKEKHLQELRANRFEKKGARKAFHLVNFLGLHQIFNNALSVYLAYVMANSSTAHKLKDQMGTTAVGKGLSKIFTFPGKVTTGLFKVCGLDTDKAFRALPEAEQQVLKAAKLHKSQRAAIETAFMCAAGFVALAPVWYLENHRVEFLNKVDNWLHPGRSKEEKEAAALQKGDEPKETWWNLLRARLVALGVVFAVDQTRDNIDTLLKESHQLSGKPGMYKNIDTELGWGLGNKIYDAMPKKVRTWFANVFSGKIDGSKVLLSGIQDETLVDTLRSTKAPDFVLKAGEEVAKLNEQKRLNFKNKALGESLEKQMSVIDQRIRSTPEGYKAVERAVFAEQSRLFITKEVFLTTVLSAVIYYCAKSPTALKFMESVGLAKKGTFEKEHAEIEARRKEAQAALHPETAHKSAASVTPEAEKERNFADAEQLKSHKVKESPALYTQKLAETDTHGQQPNLV